MVQDKMPHDIFISYSRKDSAQAEQLAELLASAGLSCWIDKSGIDFAASWSKEIVQAIDACKAFLVLLSPFSVLSPNVIKEVSLAAEQRKKILPLDLEPVELTEDLRYHLAGIQRAPMTNIDAVIRALGKLGLAATQAPSIKLVKETDARKSLMILPFEDLSPTGDNAWFADGIVSEMISALSNVKALRVMDAATTKEYKAFKGHLTTYAREMGIRYFVQGDVRKFGDNIKITSRLLDIETGDHLWQDSMKGTMDDIFDIQEKVAEKVVEGLKVHLASDEKKKLAERGTENAEAYELSMKASEYLQRETKDGIQLAVQLITEAIKLDPGYARAYQFKANALAALYSNYDRDPALLDEAETLCKEALRLKPDLFRVYLPLSQIYMHRGMLAEAEDVAKEFIRKDPQNSNSHFTLGFFYYQTDQDAKAIAPYEESVRLKPDNLVNLFNLVSACEAAGEREKCAHWAAVAIPQFERYLKLHPDDENKLVWYALLLVRSGRTEDAHAAAMKLTNLKDGISLYNTAGLFVRLGDKAEALGTFRKAIEAGFRDIRYLKEFLTDEKEGIVAHAGTPEYEEVKRMVERMEDTTGSRSL
jgi:TolB-like protein/cytochrome c-type biogenesis protein CcmH/NrfG